MEDRITALAKKAHANQRELASAIGVSESSFSDKMHGRTKFSLDQLAALADYFNVSIDYLTGRIPNYWPDPWTPKEGEQ